MTKVLKHKKESIFKKRIFKIVSKIPRGTVLTYSQVAKLAGRPRAYRAVGNILNKNPHPIEIPCHRVVKSDGRIGGYVHGVAQKRKLLCKEGVQL
ncbi:MGMT family protein [Candidatus Uhrbacteria bacterium]|nr:MGMT family protein [Candidatus Uhrbacteria bacterium]